LWQQSFIWASCFYSNNLYVPWFVFITECEFGNTYRYEGDSYWMAACIRCSYTSISEMVSKSSKPSIQKLWFSQLCWCSGHCLQLHGLCKESKHINDKQNVQTKHKPHLFRNTHRCCKNDINPICCHPFFQISSFACNKIIAYVLQWNMF
jgi:hypothetical protein